LACSGFRFNFRIKIMVSFTFLNAYIIKDILYLNVNIMKTFTFKIKIYFSSTQVIPTK
jgi:hypothetical protein